jgi:hypothetical protein
VGDSRHKVTVERTTQANVRAVTLGTDALNGIGSIPGVEDLRIESEDDGSVTLSYLWSRPETFQATDEHLAQCGLQRRWNAK